MIPMTNEIKKNTAKFDYINAILLSFLLAYDTTFILMTINLKTKTMIIITRIELHKEERKKLFQNLKNVYLDM